MCGLVGASGTPEEKIVKTLGCFSAERGTDSAGIGWLEGNSLKYVKNVGHPITLIHGELSESIKIACQNNELIFHTRQATMGSVTPKNCHPFIDRRVLFAHNGVISNPDEFGKYEVDSESLIHGILKRNFGKYIGSIALLWIQGNILYAYSCGSPLFYGKLNGTIYLASDKSYLQEARCTKVKECREGLVYAMRNGAILNTVHVPANKITEYNVKDLEYPVNMYLTKDYLSKDEKYWWKQEDAFDHLTYKK